MKTNFLFIFIFFVGIIPKLSYSQVNLSRGLVAYYPFTGSASDVSANANHGQTLNGVQLTTDRLGVPNSAYSFDGINDYIKIPNSSSINASSAMSIALYFNPSQNTVQTLIGKISQSGGIGTQFQIAMGFPPFPGVLFGLNPPATGCNTQLSLNNSYVNTGASTPVLNQWHCLVATFENGVQKIYLNGALIQTRNTGFNILNICSNSDIHIGTWWSTDPQWYKGKIDDVRIYDRAINQQEVNALCITNTVTPGFTIPDTLCVGTPVNIQNTTTGATTNYWNFCVADMKVAPSGLNLGNIGLSFSSPVFMDYAFYNGYYYGFVVNHSPGGLVRLDFGNSLLNTPTRVNLGNFGGIIPPGPAAEGIQIVFNEGSWYAIIVGGYVPSGSTPRILKIEFGASLDNPTPVATNWGNIGNMSQPIDLHVFKEGNKWYGFTVNSENNSITRFDFTTSFSNTPTAVNLGNIGNLSYPTGIYAINDNGFWRVFVINAGDDTRQTLTASLTRLDFGNSLLNTPTGTNLGNPGNVLQHSRDLTIMKMCDEIVGFAVNGHLNNSNIIKLNFNNNLSSVPTMTSLGVVGNSSFPHSISKLFRVNNDLYSFITNVDNNTITRLRFTGCSNSSIPSSTLQNPPAVTYNSPGTYSINLTVDDGMATQASFCKQVVVMELNHSPTKNYNICSGVIKIGSSIKHASYLWSTGATTDSINISSTGIYWVESSRYGCKVRDSFNVSGISSSIDFGFQQNMCNPLSVQFTSSLPSVQTYEWDFGNGQKNNSTQLPVVSFNSYGNFSIKLKAVFPNGCIDSVIKTISLSNFMDYNLIVNNDTTICLGDSILIKTDPQALAYCWQTTPATAPSLINGYIKPTSNSVYKITSQVATTNMVVNGDFSSGNTGFSSQYNYAFPNLTEGQYWIGAAPATWNSNVSNCTDHTSGSGQMMTINGSPVANAKIWSQTIAVTPNTNYNFSTWIQSLTSTNPAILQFSINNFNLGNSIIANSLACQWKQFSSTWNSGNNTTATITIMNNNIVATGNDFALDDIYFGQVITKTDSLSVTVVGLCDSVKLTGINKICSPSDTVTYSIYKSPSCTLQYALQVDNSFATIVSQTATTLKLVFKKNGRTTIGISYANNCKTVVDSLVVDVKFSPGTINLGPDLITCKDTSLVLNAGSGFETYLWQDGNTDSVRLANLSGTYSVIGQNLCGAQMKDSFKIIKTIPIPFAVSPANVIICKPDSLLFNASGGNSYSWQPSVLFSNPVSSSSKAFINSSQVFTVSITDALCVRDTVISIPIQLLPAAQITISKSNDVNCENDSAVLTASGGVSYTWSPNIYVARSFNNGITVKPPQTQTYILKGKDDRGCEGIDSVKVNFINTGNQKMYMPNAFSPNGDGLNETFKPSFIGPAKQYEFRIYNRWGELVFRSTTPGVGWNGIYKSIKQPNDVYVYYITAEGGCNGKFEQKGTFVLIK